MRTLAPIEIYGSKINALLNRAAARDLYDVQNMIYFGLFDESEEKLLRKAVVFYAALSSKREINKTFDTRAIESITARKIKTDLLPVIKKRDGFELESAKKLVKEYISDLMTLTVNEKEFLNEFSNGKYEPVLLFDEVELVNRIKEHPMAIWKTMNKGS